MKKSLEYAIIEVIILLGTGLRISELCGLTETDLDFENRVINVDHQLLRSAETGYYIEKPKTQSGIRQIPMSEKVYEALGRVLENRRGAKATTIDGYSNFLFRGRDGCPKTGVNYSNMFRGLVKKYNKCHEEAEVIRVYVNFSPYLKCRESPEIRAIPTYKNF